jgi:phosphonate transport system substrate-binding protein
VGWICGLPYVWKADSGQPPVDLLAAPVMAASRYQNRPVYFSDVLVRADSPFTHFADLRGARWVYNEPHSHSGYNLVAYHLATLGEDWRYFNEVQASGAHQVSLEMIRNGRCDASAIDSTVLEIEFANNPALQTQFRVIGTLGPSPIPPWVIRQELPDTLKQEIRQTLLTMHQHAAGLAILASYGVAQFTAVTDKDYDLIRHMAQVTAVTK